MIFFFISTLWADQDKICTQKPIPNEISWLEMIELEKVDCGNEMVPIKIRKYQNDFSSSMNKLSSKDNLLDYGQKFNAFYDPTKVVYYFSFESKKNLLTQYQSALKTQIENEQKTAKFTQSKVANVNSKLKKGLIVFASLFITSFIAILGLMIKKDKDNYDDIEKINEAASRGAELLSEKIAEQQILPTNPISNNQNLISTYESKIEKLNNEIIDHREQISKLKAKLSKTNTEQKSHPNRTPSQNLQNFQQNINQNDDRTDFFESTDPNSKLSESSKRELLNSLIALYKITPESQVSTPKFKVMIENLHSNLSKSQDEDFNNAYIYFLHTIFCRKFRYFESNAEQLRNISQKFSELGLVDSNPNAIFDTQPLLNSEGKFQLGREPLEITGDSSVVEFASRLSRITNISFSSIYWKVHHDKITLQISPSSSWRIEIK